MGETGAMDRMQRPEVRWGLGCLLSGIGFAGLLIIVLWVAILTQPPAWLQVALGLGIVVGAALFTWILASAFGASRRRPPESGTRPDVRSVKGSPGGSVDETPRGSVKQPGEEAVREPDDS